MILAADVGGVRLLLEQLVVQSHLQAGEVGLRGAQLQLGVHELLLNLLVAELEDDGVGGEDLGARQRDDALYGGVGFRGDPADVFGHERSRPSGLADHLAALDGLAPGRAALDGGRGRLQLREDHGDERHHDDGRAGDDCAANLLLLRDRCGTCNIHEVG